MTELHYELGDKPQPFTDTYQIRATRDIPHLGVRKGDLGGYIEGLYTPDGLPRLRGDSWVADEALVRGEAFLSGCALLADKATLMDRASIHDYAVVRGDAVVYGSATVRDHGMVMGATTLSGNSQVRGTGTVTGDAALCGNAIVQGRGVVTDFARVRDDVVVTDDAFVGGTASVHGHTRLGGNSRVYGCTLLKQGHFMDVVHPVDIGDTRHVMSVGPIGSEDVTAELVRTKDGGHLVIIGCWDGTVDTMMDEVRVRSQYWGVSATERDTLIEEYEHLHKLFKKRIALWSL